jgi:hypothetical protein
MPCTTFEEKCVFNQAKTLDFGLHIICVFFCSSHMKRYFHDMLNVHIPSNPCQLIRIGESIEHLHVVA